MGGIRRQAGKCTLRHRLDDTQYTVIGDASSVGSSRIASVHPPQSGNLYMGQTLVHNPRKAP